ncbi:hypothetical protein [Streptomyces sp. NPDC051162]|uniref:hypothetical protein n=1 Tax=Streptomyces sp. NPDC051162 TaxID=3154747 RepID=UPI003437C6B7
MTPHLWFESLTDSAFALGAAAREAQRAYRSAQLTTDHYDLDRLKSVDGELVIAGRSMLSPSFRPHHHALFVIGDTLREQEDKLRALYWQTSIAYAYGTARAILQVLDGQQPAAVELERTRDGYAIPQELCPVPPAIEGLARWVGAEKFERARQVLERCDFAGDFADHLHAQDYISDHEAGELHQALDTASGLPDAAYAYGELAESALHFALLEPRTQHARAQTSR